MASPIAMSTATMSRTGVTRPALSQLAVTHTVQSRSIWHCARDNHSSHDNTERTYRGTSKQPRHPQTNRCRKSERRQDWPSTAPIWDWSLGRRQPTFSDLSAGRVKSFWETEKEQMEQRIATLRKQIAEDPYGAIFGRRLDPFFTGSKDDSFLPGFLRSSMKNEPTGATQSTKAHLQDFNFAKSPSNSSAARDMRQYDPISGRMAPKPPSPMESATTAQTSRGVDCPPGSEVEAKYASSASLVEDGQFQPGSVPINQVTTGAPNPQSLDCPPGSEIETLFTTNPASYKDTNATIKMRHDHGSTGKLNANIVCPPGNELESLFVSESVRTQQPHAETLNIQGSSNQRDGDAGLSPGENVECAPGSELEAMFVANPSARAKQSQPLKAFDASSASQNTDMTVDCPPGNELDAKFAAESAGMGPQVETRRTNRDVGANIDCSPGSELGAKILSELVTPPPEQFVAQTTVDCPPGSELEAKFTVDPASTENGHYQPFTTAETAIINKADVTVDCAPGSELEALFKSEAVSSTSQESENSVPLSASDIRARYTSLPSNKNEISSSKTLDFDGSEDRVGDLLKHQANTNGEAPKTWSSADYRILAYDASISKVTTAEAESFFGVNETVQPHEILARLHNPAKFVPYFEQMQDDGYEIATGGGDILVFRKSLQTSTPKTAAQSQSQTIHPATHAKIANLVRHDSYDLSTSSSVSSSTSTSPSFTTKPADVSSRSSSEPTGSKSRSDSSDKAESVSRRVFRRVIFAGTVMAATCYAIGVVTEYFRTGGIDGRGIDGFTVFESDRRRRE